MNIEDLIRAANPVTASDVAAGDSPHARRTLARILTEHADPGAGGRGRLARPRKRRTLFAVGLAAIAAGATAAVLVVPAAPREVPRKPPAAAPGVRAATLHPPKAELTSARQVLLTAAAHVHSGPASGAYWRVQMISGTNWPGGTKAHPYDITVSTGYDQ